MRVPPLDLVKQHQPLRDEILSAVTNVLDSGQFILGPVVEQFEKNTADYCQTEYAVGMSSGTDALIAALMALDIGPGDEVIIPTFTFYATAGSVWRVGATPVFADIDPVTFNIDTASLESLITVKTKAIMPVHLFGQCADMDPIINLANQYSLFIIEDAAQAIGSEYHGQRAGGIGHIGCLSYYPTKNLGGAGDSGMCTTNDEELAQKLKQARLHGQTDVYHHEFVGGNFRIDPLQAAILDIKLKHLDDYAAARIKRAQHYLDVLADSPLTLPNKDEGHVYNQFTVRAPKRDELRNHLREQGVFSGIYYPLPLHLQPCFAALGKVEGDFPIAEQASKEVLSLPIFPEMTDEQQQLVVDGINTFYN